MKQPSSKTEEKLKLEFARFREDPAKRFQTKLKQERARQLRQLLSDPDAMDLETFNRQLEFILYSTQRREGRTRYRGRTNCIST